MATDPDDILTQYNVACVYAKLGETDAAFDLLERLLPHANHETKSWVRHDPDFDSLRAQPRYRGIETLLA
jgi:adenylate cyclase